MRKYLIPILAIVTAFFYGSCNYLKPAAQREAEANEARCKELGYNWFIDERVNKVLDRGPISKTVDTVGRAGGWDGHLSMITVILTYDEFEIERSVSSTGESMAKDMGELIILPFTIFDNNGKVLNGRTTFKYNPLSRATEQRIQNLLNHRR